MYIRYENLKHIVLNELLAEHDHAELDAQLDEAAWWSTLRRKHTHLFSIHRHKLIKNIVTNKLITSSMR